jgi:hypothetical protein
MASDLEAWVGSDWETDYEPYLFANILGYYDETVSDYAAFETGYTWAFELDSAGELLADTDGYLIPIEYDGSTMPKGYIASAPYWLMYVEGLFY